MRFYKKKCVVQCTFTNCIIPPFWFITICFFDTIIFIYYVWAFFKFMIHMNSPRPTTRQRHKVRSTYAYAFTLSFSFRNGVDSFRFLSRYYHHRRRRGCRHFFLYLFSPVYFILQTFETYKGKAIAVGCIMPPQEIFFSSSVCLSSFPSFSISVHH